MKRHCKTGPDPIFLYLLGHPALEKSSWQPVKIGHQSGCYEFCTAGLRKDFFMYWKFGLLRAKPKILAFYGTVKWWSNFLSNNIYVNPGGLCKCLTRYFPESEWGEGIIGNNVYSDEFFQFLYFKYLLKQLPGIVPATWYTSSVCIFNYP